MPNSSPSSSRKEMVDRYTLPPIRDILGAHLSPSSSPKMTENKYLPPTTSYDNFRHGGNIVQSNYHYSSTDSSAGNSFLGSSSPKILSRTAYPADTSRPFADQRFQDSHYTGNPSLDSQSKYIKSCSRLRSTQSVSARGHKSPPILPDKCLDFEESASETEISRARNLLTVTKTEADSEEGSSQYQCPYCFKLFTRPSGLKIHINVHTGEKPFQCLHPGCGRYFSVQSNMRRHMRIHIQDLKRQQDSALEDGEQAEVLLMPAPAFHG